MTFYTMTFVGRVDESGQPVTDLLDGKPSVREIPIWDERKLDEMIAGYKAEGVIKTERLGSRHAPGRPLERRGPVAVFAPHLIAIEPDLKSAFRQREPLPFAPRWQ